MKIAVVTIAHGRHRHLVAQQRSLMAGSTTPFLYVVVAMADPTLERHLDPSLCPEIVHVAACPARLPLASARNAGAERAYSLGANVVIMLDVDCLAGRDLVAGYGAAVRRSPDVIWSGPVTYLPPPGPTGYALEDLDELDNPHPARPAPKASRMILGGSPDLFWSLSFAIDRTAWERVGGFCEAYLGYGGEDTDFGHLAVSAGIGLGWTGTPRAYHQHHPTADPPVNHLDDILRNGRLFYSRWGRWPMEGWLTEFAQQGLVEQHEGGWRRKAVADKPQG
jgi:N-acetylglucosaminyl-diphospho-decaprenol L-rhamnosyltransferase